MGVGTGVDEVVQVVEEAGLTEEARVVGWSGVGEVTEASAVEEATGVSVDEDLAVE